MTADTAARLVSKLRAVTTDRGATAPEAALAAEKAASLIARFDLDPRVGAEEPRPTRVRAAPPAGSRWQGGQRFDRPWSFDVQTGNASSNVKVHSHRGKWDWKIEIMPD